MSIKYEPGHDKTNKMSVRPAKTQINLGISLVWSESLLSAWRKLWSLATHQAHTLLVLSWHGSYEYEMRVLCFWVELDMAQTDSLFSDSEKFCDFSPCMSHKSEDLEMTLATITGPLACIVSRKAVINR